MSKKNDKLDPNVKRFLEEMEARKNDDSSDDSQQLKEGEYVICPGCGEKISKHAKTCPTCGARQRASYYTPISDKTAAKIRFIVGTIMVVAFFVIYIFVINK